MKWLVANDTSGWRYWYVRCGRTTVAVAKQITGTLFGPPPPDPDRPYKATIDRDGRPQSLGWFSTLESGQQACVRALQKGT